MIHPANILRRFLLVLPACVLLPWTASAQSTVRVDSLYAPSLHAIRHFCVLLPDSYDPSHRYPILYLLHGYSGGYRDWIDRTDIEYYAAAFPLIVVMPDAGNSWYVNSVADTSERFEDYIVNDVRLHIESGLSVDTSRRAIAGLSMGGYGALVLAFRHPDLFRFAGTLSGALSVPDDIREWETHTWGKSIAPSLKHAFGDRPGAFWADHDLFRLFRATPSTRLPYAYLVAGEQDGFTNFLPANRAFADSLRMYGAPYEYHELPGVHSWKFWDREIQPLLKRLHELFEERK